MRSIVPMLVIPQHGVTAVAKIAKRYDSKYIHETQKDKTPSHYEWTLLRRGIEMFYRFEIRGVT